MVRLLSSKFKKLETNSFCTSPMNCRNFDKCWNILRTKGLRPGGMTVMLENTDKFTDNELSWLLPMLSCEFLRKEQIIQQIESANVVTEHTRWYLSLQFEVNKSLPLVDSKTIPVEMWAYKEGQCPIEFLLWVKDGYVSELEIFFADFSEINENIDISDAKIEFTT